MRLLDWMGPSPRAFVEGFDPARRRAALRALHYRFTRGRDVAAAVLAIHRLIDRHGSLRAAFVSGYRAEEPDIRPTLQRFATSILEQDLRPVGMTSLTRGLPPPVPGSGSSGRLQALAPLPPLDDPPARRRTSGTGERSRRRSS